MLKIVKSLKNLNQVTKELEKATREVKTSAKDVNVFL